MAESCPACNGPLYGPVGYCPHCGSALDDALRARFADPQGSDPGEPVIAWSEPVESEPHGEDRPAHWAEYKERRLKAATPEPAQPDIPERTCSDGSADAAPSATARTELPAPPAPREHPARNFPNNSEERASPPPGSKPAARRGSRARRRLRNLVLAALAVVFVLSHHDYFTRDRAGRTFTDCSDCPKMVVIPLGSFDMGSPPNEPGRYVD